MCACQVILTEFLVGKGLNTIHLVHCNDQKVLCDQLKSCNTYGLCVLIIVFLLSVFATNWYASFPMVCVNYCVSPLWYAAVPMTCMLIIVFLLSIFLTNWYRKRDLKNQINKKISNMKIYNSFDRTSLKITYYQINNLLKTSFYGHSITIQSEATSIDAII